MRCDQSMGLPLDANVFLTLNSDQTDSIYDYYEGMFGDKYPLYQYCLNDGRTAEEFLQADPWSSGPCFFLGLRVSDGTEFLWPDEEIDNA